MMRICPSKCGLYNLYAMKMVTLYIMKDKWFCTTKLPILLLWMREFIVISCNLCTSTDSVTVALIHRDIGKLCMVCTVHTWDTIIWSRISCDSISNSNSVAIASHDNIHQYLDIIVLFAVWIRLLIFGKTIFRSYTIWQWRVWNLQNDSWIHSTKPIIITYID